MSHVKRRRVDNIDDKRHRVYYIDSGASAHMTPWLDDLYITDECNTIVRLADNSTTHAKYRGKLKHILLDNVLYIPSLVNGLISVSKLDRDGCTCIARGGTMIVINPEGSILIKGTLVSGGLYEIADISDNDMICNQVEENKEKIDPVIGMWKWRKSKSILGLNPLEILHKRWGHLSEKAIKWAIKHNKVTGAKVSYDDIKDLTMRVCIDCERGRMTEVSLESRGQDWLALRPFEQVANRL